MTPKYLNASTRQQDRWMVSYLDVLTIILIFFLLVAARTLAAPAPVKLPQPNRRAELIRASQLLKQRGVESALDSRGLVVTFSQVVLFAPGDDEVNPAAFDSLDQIAEVLRTIPNEVRLVGHADATPIHNRRFRNNWELSIARSQSILELLSSRCGIEEQRLSLASYGTFRPTASNDTPDGRASNRRVEFIILDSQPL